MRYKLKTFTMEEKNIIKETGCGLASILIFSAIIGFNVFMFWLFMKIFGWEL